MFALAAAIPTVGWMVYTNPEWKLRPNPLNDDWRLYEQAGLMLGWLLMIGIYWHRSAASAWRSPIGCRPEGCNPGSSCSERIIQNTHGLPWVSAFSLGTRVY